MKTHPIESRLREALNAHAKTFSASPDAWQHVQQKRDVRATSRRRARAGWLTRHSAFLIPATAAAAVAALVLGATAFAHGFSASRGAPAHASASRPAARHDTRPLPPNGLQDPYPAISPIVSDAVTRTITAWYWLARPSPNYWFSYPAAGAQFCYWLDDGRDGSGDCWPMPVGNQGNPPALVISNNSYLSGSNPVITGLVGPPVTSVTAVLPDGRRFSGVIGTIPVFGVKAWSVNCPAARGTTLIFAGANGKVITTRSTKAPAGPIVLDVPRPSHGGVTMFSYPASFGAKAGSVTAYLVDGHVAFFQSGAFAGSGAFSPSATAVAPAIGGMAQPYGRVCNPDCRSTDIKAFGYAHGDVAKVAVRLPGGGEVTADTFSAGWAGSDVRLWRVTLPESVWPPNGTQPKLIATAYDAAGQTIGQTQLGQPQI
jgi:hypothetical protein